MMNRTGSYLRAVRDGSSRLGQQETYLESSQHNGSYDLVIPDWDDWDEDLWTPEQRQLLEQGAAPRHVYIILGVLLSLVVVFGLVANATILYVFSRYCIDTLRASTRFLINSLELCWVIFILLAQPIQLPHLQQYANALQFQMPSFTTWIKYYSVRGMLGKWDRSR